jgi:hypothetical protein
MKAKYYKAAFWVMMLVIFDASIFWDAPSIKIVLLLSIFQLAGCVTGFMLNKEIGGKE